MRVGELDGGEFPLAQQVARLRKRQRGEFGHSAAALRSGGRRRRSSRRGALPAPRSWERSTPAKASGEGWSSADGEGKSAYPPPLASPSTRRRRGGGLLLIALLPFRRTTRLPFRRRGTSVHRPARRPRRCDRIGRPVVTGELAHLADRTGSPARVRPDGRISIAHGRVAALWAGRQNLPPALLK